MLRLGSIGPCYSRVANSVTDVYSEHLGFESAQVHWTSGTLLPPHPLRLFIKQCGPGAASENRFRIAEPHQDTCGPQPSIKDDHVCELNRFLPLPSLTSETQTLYSIPRTLRYYPRLYCLPHTRHQAATFQYVLSDCRTVCSLQMSIPQTRHRSLSELRTTRTCCHREDSACRLCVSRPRQKKGPHVDSISSI